METQEVTLKAKLLAFNEDNMGYITYVFENIEAQNENDRYTMCVRFPNWVQDPFDCNEEGFLTIRYVRAGIDTWYNGTSQVPYKYTNIIFLKFIKLKPNINIEEIQLD